MRWWPLLAGVVGAGAIVALREQQAGGEEGPPGFETIPGQVPYVPDPSTNFETFPGIVPWEEFVSAGEGHPDNPYTPGHPAWRVYEACRAAGFTVEGARTMTAIAGAESTWNPNALCDSCARRADGSVIVEYSVGVFQINLLAHPWVSEACARDPICAARAAYQISGAGANFRPWATFTSGKYRSYLA